MELTLDEIQKQIADLLEKENELILAEKEAVVSRLKADITKFKLTAKDLGFEETTKAKKGTKSTIAPKYEKDGKQWSGRGIQPAWIKTHLANGLKLEDLLIIKE